MRRHAIKWNRENPARCFAAYLQRTYGITSEQFEKMRQLQKGRCKLCNAPPLTRAKTIRRLFVDHDHKTERVRGLLCYRCNRALPDYITDPAWFSRAQDYVTSAFDGRAL